MADRTTASIRELLTQAKPGVPCPLKRSPTLCRNSRDFEWPNVTIKIWDDFNLQTLDASFGPILDIQDPTLTPIPSPAQHFDNVEISAPKEARHLTHWGASVVKPALDFARSHLGLQEGLVVNHKLTSPHNSVRLKISSTLSIADHLAVLDDFPEIYLVVGVTRPAHKFTATTIAERKGVGVSDEQRWPLRLLAHSCKTAETRFGYILTEETLLACSFNALPPQQGSTTPLVEAAVMPVPWSRHGPKQLTTDLAIWWLCMLVLSEPSRRKITPRAQTVGINHWELHKYEDVRGWVSRHMYSHAEFPTDPPPPEAVGVNHWEIRKSEDGRGWMFLHASLPLELHIRVPPPPYQTPSPGNVAAFEAAVGINMRSDFEIEPVAPDLFEGMSEFGFAMQDPGVPGAAAGHHHVGEHQHGSETDNNSDAVDPQQIQRP